MKLSNEYYLSQYGVAPLVQPQRPQGPRYDPTTLDYESSVGGEFDYFSDQASYAQVGYGPNDLAALEGGTQAAGDAVPQDAMIEELDGLVGEETAPQADPLALLQEIKEELKKPESQVLPEEAIEDFEDRISDLGEQARKSDVSFDELLGSIDELKWTIADAVAEATANHQEKAQALGASVESLLDKVGKSKLDSEKKSGFQSKLEGLQGDLREEGADLEEIREKLNELNQEITREIKVAELSRDLETLPSKIPSEGWHKEQTMELATKLTEALRSGEWGSVKNYLQDKRDNHKNEGNNFIPQLIGTIFMDLAGSDENKLDQFLALIPSEIRELMAQAATQEDVNSTEHLDNPLKYKYYGRPSATADRLRSSRIDEALEQIEAEPLPE
ncbi:MAG TPA: hypothetical protein VJR29_04300 [bacterium]|nr:hypothetical protein [bacterium]